ncbi:MAG: NAD(+) synthase [Anaerovibrio sp.]|uniref:NAD(+) synthase n=1 Tax=Anaerovibrio sp. TaxID=1872532 RepID=UPI0025E641CF|nr:NAD(+) synthase [Anaerovibrio sp.]MCR5175830.1 NAD(+) synthase [Anaerovibrio sp.]
MLKIAMAQIRVIPGHPDENTRKMLSFIKEAKENGADIIIFPEMSIPGYLLGDTWEQRAFIRDCEECGKDIIAASQGIVIIFGNVAVDWNNINNDGRPRKFNALFTASNGKLLKPDTMPYPFVIKTLMPNYREFDDTRHFFSLKKLAEEKNRDVRDLISPVHVDINGKTYSIGGFLCEDGWSDNYHFSPVDVLAEKGIDFLVNISSSPYTIGKNTKRHKIFGNTAKATGAPLFYVNNIGIQNNGKTVYTFDGASTVYSTKGYPVDCIDKYTENLHYIDFETISQLPEYKPNPKKEIGNIFDSLAYGIKAFLADIGMKKVVIGISGGIDSAVAAALYSHIAGPDNVLLVNMPSKYNSATTRGLAEKLAENLGCNYVVLPIQESVEHTISQLENTPIHALQNNTDFKLKVSSFVAENIQARDRSARILAGAAAAFGGGFTCNANKAETSVGYSTLYGDQSGFLCALADLWKFQVYALAGYLNDEIYGREVIPQETIDIVPSAELSTAQNVDEGKGDPLKYPYHDYLFRSFIERWEKATPADILRWYKDGMLEDKIGCEKGLIKKYFSTTEEFIEDLEYWWRQFNGMAIAKRIQAPPIMAVSRRAFGFDHRESQNGIYYTREYYRLKKELLGK